MRIIWTSLLAAACAGGGGGDDDDDDGGGGDTAAEATPTDEWFIKGWLQRTGEATGALAEAEIAALPEDCDGELGTTGPALATVTTRSGRPFLPADLEEWPGRGPVTPIYRVSVDGAATRAADGALISVVAEPSGGADTVVYLDVCDTVVERGACHVRGPGFPFDGCVGTFGQDPGFVIGELVLESTGDGFTAGFDYGYACNNSNRRDVDHPDGVGLGAQRLTVSVADLPDGERVALPADAVTWAGSVVVDKDCEYVEEAGDFCDCTWGFREDVTLAAAWAQRDGDAVHLFLKGLGDDAPFLLWGTFPLR